MSNISQKRLCRLYIGMVGWKLLGYYSELVCAYQWKVFIEKLYLNCKLVGFYFLSNVFMAFSLCSVSFTIWENSIGNNWSRTITLTPERPTDRQKILWKKWKNWNYCRYWSVKVHLKKLVPFSKKQFLAQQKYCASLKDDTLCRVQFRRFLLLKMSSWGSYLVN